MGPIIRKFRLLRASKQPKGVFYGVSGGSAWLSNRVFLLMGPIIRKFWLLRASK